MMNWLRCPSMPMLILAAVLLGLAPFHPEPHLVEKTRMLLGGKHLRLIDWFDILFHSWPMLWLALRLLAPSSARCRLDTGRGN